MKRVLAVSVLCACAAGLVLAGELEPPVQPNPTMKPLDQIEPRTPITAVPVTLSAPGSYYLVGNLVCASEGQSAVTVAADNVTIDLGGFTISGPGATHGSGNGILLSSRRNVEIRNGTVRNFGGRGIYESLSDGWDVHVVNVRVIANGEGGIKLGRRSLIRDCVVSDNGAADSQGFIAISVWDSSIITGNTVCHNDVWGTGVGNYSSFAIIAGADSTISENIVSNNARNAIRLFYSIYASNGCMVVGNSVCTNGVSAAGGVRGIHVGDACTVKDNTIEQNGLYASGEVYALWAAYGCTISGNTIRANHGLGLLTRDSAGIHNNVLMDNAGDGIQAGDRCRLSGNQSDGNSGNGILVGDHCCLTGNTTVGNNLNGVNAGWYCTITGGTANRNVQRGIHANDYSTVTDCTASQNQEEGIWAMSFTTVTGCNAGNNQKAGIFCWTGKVVGNTVCNNNQVDDASAGGLQTWYAAQVEKNTCFDNKQCNIWINRSGSTAEGNYLRGSIKGVYFAESGSFYKDNRCSGATTAWANTAGNTDGGGNVSF